MKNTTLLNINKRFYHKSFNDFQTNNFFNLIYQKNDIDLFLFIKNMRHDFIKNACIDEINNIDNVSRYLLYVTYHNSRDNATKNIINKYEREFIYNSFDENIAFENIARHLIYVMHYKNTLNTSNDNNVF